MPSKGRRIRKSEPNRNEPWSRKTGAHQYALKTRTPNRTFLIVCEGQTEEIYFSSFPVLTATIRSLGTGHSKTALVETVDRLRRGGAYDEIWCVFDFDHDPMTRGQIEDFNKAIDLARTLGYNCAYSNDCFELWFVLHYQYSDQQLLRENYSETLGTRWNINYEKEGKRAAFTRTIYRRLAEDTNANQQRAIGHAQKLLTQHDGKPFHLQNPVTTVFQLVERLNAHCRS